MKQWGEEEALARDARHETVRASMNILSPQTLLKHAGKQVIFLAKLDDRSALPKLSVLLLLECCGDVPPEETGYSDRRGPCRVPATVGASRACMQPIGRPRARRGYRTIGTYTAEERGRQTPASSESQRPHSRDSRRDDERDLDRAFRSNQQPYLLRFLARDIHMGTSRELQAMTKDHWETTDH
jgi:hypothetical protein